VRHNLARSPLDHNVTLDIRQTRFPMTSTRRRSAFRPCIDLHDGRVKQIVGGTLSDADPNALQTNFVARHARFLGIIA
jgi:hypothetical protein